MARNGRKKGHLTVSFIFTQTIGQIFGEHFAKFCGLLRIYEL